jgi:hypothetical protein
MNLAALGPSPGIDRIGVERQEASRHPPPPDSWRRFPPALSSLAMPARHCHHDSTERRKLCTITLESVFMMRWNPDHHEPQYAGYFGGPVEHR